MWPDRVSNPGPPTPQSDMLLTELCGQLKSEQPCHFSTFVAQLHVMSNVRLVMKIFQNGIMLHCFLFHWTLVIID